MRASFAQEIEPCLHAFASLPHYESNARYEALKPLSLEILFELHRIYRKGNPDLTWGFYGLFDDDVEHHAYNATIAWDHVGASIHELYDRCEKLVFSVEPHDLSGELDVYALWLAFLSVFEKMLG